MTTILFPNPPTPPREVEPDHAGEHAAAAAARWIRQPAVIAVHPHHPRPAAGLAAAALPSARRFGPAQRARV